MEVLGVFYKLWSESGFSAFFTDGGWKNLIMILIAFVLLYLGIVKKFEPLLLVGIAFGCLLSNLSYFVALGGGNALYHPELWEAFLDEASPFYHSYGHIRLSDTVQNALMNIITIFLATSVGATMGAETFLNIRTIYIIFLGLVSFSISTAGGLLGGIVMYKTSGGQINPLIGSAGVSAVPMAARVSQDVGRKYNKNNYLLMHAMGPNVAGVIGSAIAAGFLLSVFG